jgi:putative Holliday junction resolvase
LFFTVITIYPLFLQKIVLGRILAIDYGVKRTGIAVTDELQLIASGLTTVATRELIPFLKEYLEKETVDLLLIGEPKQMDNTPSESEKHIAKFINKLIQQVPDIQIERVDERFTSKMAVQSMIAGGMKKGKRKNKALVDEISATLILQGFLNKV